MRRMLGKASPPASPPVSRTPSISNLSNLGKVVHLRRIKSLPNILPQSVVLNSTSVLYDVYTCREELHQVTDFTNLFTNHVIGLMLQQLVSHAMSLLV